MRIDERRPNLVAGDAALVQAEGRTRLGDEVGDNVTRLPAPSLDVRGHLACANIARPGWLDLIRQRSGERRVDSSPDSNLAAMPLACDRRSGPDPVVAGPSRTLQQPLPGSTDQKVGPNQTGFGRVHGPGHSLYVAR